MKRKQIKQPKQIKKPVQKTEHQMCIQAFELMAYALFARNASDKETIKWIFKTLGQYTKWVIKIRQQSRNK